MSLEHNCVLSSVDIPCRKVANPVALLSIVRDASRTDTGQNTFQQVSHVTQGCELRNTQGLDEGLANRHEPFGSTNFCREPQRTRDKL